MRYYFLLLLTIGLRHICTAQLKQRSAYDTVVINEASQWPERLPPLAAPNLKGKLVVVDYKQAYMLTQEKIKDFMQLKKEHIEVVDVRKNDLPFEEIYFVTTKK